MAKKARIDKRGRPTRYEFRVWGKHRSARKMLVRLASDVSKETFDDCYLLLDHDPSWNAKVRDNTLKLKQLVAEDKGFEQWSKGRHHSAESTPSPFDKVFAELRLDRPTRGKKYDLHKYVERLDPDSGVRAVFVTKQRKRYYIGAMTAEVTDIEIHNTGRVLRTLSIEGDDLAALVKLRKKLGIRDEPNVAMHQLIDAETTELA